MRRNGAPLEEPPNIARLSTTSARSLRPKTNGIDSISKLTQQILAFAGHTCLSVSVTRR